MKRCPSCNRTYTDLSLNFCLEDGTPLVPDAPPPSDPNATVRYTPSRDTAEPPPTEIYRPDSPLISQPPITQPQPPQPPPQQWTPTPSVPPQRKSNAIWWILGGLAAVLVVGAGLVVMIIALASMSNSNNSNANTNSNTNGTVANKNANANATPSKVNSNSATPGTFVDNFTEQKWGTGDSKFGHIWYTDDEYHMSSKSKTYVAIYAPSDEYSTANATIKVTARSVDGRVPSNGFGLMVHCEKSKAQQLEDYALLIYPSEEPEYEVIMHKDGNQTSLVPKTKSSAIRPGTSPNQLEVRVKGTELSFYVNGQFLTTVTDSQNYKGGRAGLYTSDEIEVAFDDMEITKAKN